MYLEYFSVNDVFESYLSLYNTKCPLGGVVTMSIQMLPRQPQAFLPPVEYILTKVNHS